MQQIASFYSSHNLQESNAFRGVASQVFGVGGGGGMHRRTKRAMRSACQAAASDSEHEDKDISAIAAACLRRCRVSAGPRPSTVK